LRTDKTKRKYRALITDRGLIWGTLERWRWFTTGECGRGEEKGEERRMDK